MPKPTLDLRLYLVTDSTEAILKGRDLCSVVSAAIDGGVTIVQYRDKTSDTGELIKTARKLHGITSAKGVPLLINDRVDVALVVGAEGVHIGQDDMDIQSARGLLGKDAIIGVTASSGEEAESAILAGADYLGIGTVYATPTKENTKSIIGTAGVRHILAEITVGLPVSTVCIGGINASNAERVLQQSRSMWKTLDGIAVVSAVIGADDAKRAAQELRGIVERRPVVIDEPQRERITQNSVTLGVPALTRRLAETKPLCHNMTNMVVQNIAANVALCVGASPIMSNNGREAPDLAKLGGSLVVNMGTVTPEGLANNIAAIRAYNDVGGPIVFDPVGAGATQQRRDAVKQLLANSYFDVIKGNENEILTVAGKSDEVQQRGVDGSGTLGSYERIREVKQLAIRENNIVLMTGAVDIVSDGRHTFQIHNGHELLGEITGSGCTLGTTVAAYLAVGKQDKLLATVAALLHFEIAAERAVAKLSTPGPGTFVPAWLDELYFIKRMSLAGDFTWVNAAKFSVSRAF